MAHFLKKEIIKSFLKYITSVESRPTAIWHNFWTHILCELEDFSER